VRVRIWLGILIGSTIGGALPLLWGGEALSYASVLLSTVGGLAGIWLVASIW
jgi:hypothetical protein